MTESRLRSLAMSLAILGLAHAAFADPPFRVARISYVSGSVSFRPASQDEWSGAIRNYPLTVGDEIWTSQDGRAELALGTSFVRVAEDTACSLLNLDDRLAQLRITQGAVTVRVRDLADEGVEIDTPSGAVTIDQPGSYRVDVDEWDGRTTVTVRSGRAEAITFDATYTVDARQSIVLGDGSPYVLQSALGLDDFEDWSAVRDRRVESSQSVRYVSPSMIGYEDLDEYGTWRDTPGYGEAWYPRTRADWAPYRFGRWAWIDPWGWSWIDDEPWGFAPSHYGRWLHASGGWAWIPGNALARPVYAPALVAFVGGSGWEASFSVGSAPIGWFPLGPREPYVPAFGASSNYLRAVNAPYVDVRVNVDVGSVRYANRDVPGAFTAVPRDAFGRGRPVNSATISVPSDAFRNATPTQAGPGRPSRADLAGGATRGTAPPPAAITRPVVVRQTPAADTRAPFKNASPATAVPRTAPVGAARPPRERTAPAPDATQQERAAPAPRAAPQERVAPVPRTAPQEQAAPAPKAAPRERATPAPRTAPQERAAPAPRTAPQEQAAPAPKAAPRERATPAPKEAPKEQAAPARRTAPQEKAAPKNAPKEQASPAAKDAPKEKAAPATKAVPKAKKDPGTKKDEEKK